MAITSTTTKIKIKKFFANRKVQAGLCIVAGFGIAVGLNYAASKVEDHLDESDE